jgi:hypothetical protein
MHTIGNLAHHATLPFRKQQLQVCHYLLELLAMSSHRKWAYHYLEQGQQAGYLHACAPLRLGQMWGPGKSWPGWRPLEFGSPDPKCQASLRWPSGWLSTSGPICTPSLQGPLLWASSVWFWMGKALDILSKSQTRVKMVRGGDVPMSTIYDGPNEVQMMMREKSKQAQDEVGEDRQCTNA